MNHHHYWSQFQNHYASLHGPTEHKEYVLMYNTSKYIHTSVDSGGDTPDDDGASPM